MTYNHEEILPHAFEYSRKDTVSGDPNTNFDREKLQMPISYEEQSKPIGAFDAFT